MSSLFLLQVFWLESPISNKMWVIKGLFPSFKSIHDGPLLCRVSVIKAELQAAPPCQQ